MLIPANKKKNKKKEFKNNKIGWNTTNKIKIKDKIDNKIKLIFKQSLVNLKIL
jgi:hypothetical protein